MEFSLIEWAKTNKALPQQCDLQTVSYPLDGAQNLAHMEPTHFWFTSRREQLLKLLKKYVPQNAHGLDVGCGSGFNTDYFSKNGFPTMGIDAHEIHRLPSAESLGFIRGDIFSIKPRAEFDFITLLDVIEHIEHDQKFLQQVMRFLKPGGFIIITVPAFSFLWSPVDEISGHYRRYTKQQMSALAKDLSLSMKKQFYFYGSVLPLYFASRILSQIKKDSTVSANETAPPTAVNTTLKAFLKFEALFTPLGGSPVGSSLFTVLRKSL